jgi:hypothetical protein
MLPNRKKSITTIINSRKSGKKSFSQIFILQLNVCWLLLGLLLLHHGVASVWLPMDGAFIRI